MRATRLLHTLFDNACQSLDKRIRKTLFSAAQTLIFCKELSIAGVGRSLQRSAKVKHNIKCIDRLFGNQQLRKKRKLVYAAMAKLLLCENKHPLIIIDWSGLTPCGAYHFLSASLAVKGRSMTLYEECHPLNKYMGRKTHQQFLMILKEIIPKTCVPIIITDAGFRNTWFTAVLKLKWHFIGRVRNKTMYKKTDTQQWVPIKNLYRRASQKACYLGQVLLSKSNSLLCYFYLMKQKNKHRMKKNLVGKKVQCSSSKKHAKGAKEPWLIVSSLSPADVSAKIIMLFYKKRMQIEESFRDLKNTRNGLGLRHCRNRCAERLNVALLIAALAILVLWLFGMATKQQNLHYSFLSNTEKRRQVLSSFMIGWQVVIQNQIQFSKKDLLHVLRLIISLARENTTC